MNTTRKTAVIVGILFILGTASGISAGVLSEPLRADPLFPQNIAANENRWISGALFVSLMGILLAMVPVMLYPILKKRNPVLAAGAVLFRGAIEAISYAAMAICMLLMVNISRLFENSGSAKAETIQILGKAVWAAKEWSELWGSLVFSIGAVMIYTVFLQTRLVPRWLSGWGLAGGVLYFIANIASMLDPQHAAASLGSGLGMLMIPLAIQEMVFAGWLILKGFDRAALQRLSAPGVNNPAD